MSDVCHGPITGLASRGSLDAMANFVYQAGDDTDCEQREPAGTHHTTAGDDGDPCRAAFREDTPRGEDQVVG